MRASLLASAIATNLRAPWRSSLEYDPNPHDVGLTSRWIWEAENPRRAGAVIGYLNAKASPVRNYFSFYLLLGALGDELGNFRRSQFTAQHF